MLRTQKYRSSQQPAHCGRKLWALLSLAQRFRSLRTPAALFRRTMAGGLAGLGWIPCTWKDRRGVLIRWLRSHTLRIHRGRRWRRLYVQRWVVGFAVGNFARTQTLAVFKKKASAKKQRHRLHSRFGSTLQLDWRVQRIRDVRAGTRRRASLLYNANFETQLRGVV